MLHLLGLDILQRLIFCLKVGIEITGLPIADPDLIELADKGFLRVLLVLSDILSNRIFLREAAGGYRLD